MSHNNHHRGRVHVDPIVTGCAQSNYPRILHNKASWDYIRHAYVRSRQQLQQREHGHSSSSKIDQRNGFLIPYEVRNSVKRGRGVYPTTQIKKGTKMWTSRRHYKTFKTEQAFRVFMDLLNSYDLRCEILLWAYPSGGKACVDLDDGSFINHSDNPDEINFGLHGEALRDIPAGEELLMNYTEFISYNDERTTWFDVIRAMAWEEEDSSASNNNNSDNNNNKDQQGDSSTVYRSTGEYNRLGVPPPPVRDHGNTTIVVGSNNNNNDAAAAAAAAANNKKGRLGRRNDATTAAGGIAFQLPDEVLGFREPSSSQRLLFHGKNDGGIINPVFHLMGFTMFFTLMIWWKAVRRNCLSSSHSTKKGW